MGKYVILSDYKVWPWSEDCLTTLDDMCMAKDTDDHKKRFFYTIPCVDYDNYDASLATKEGRPERPTVDGIANLHCRSDKYLAEEI